MQAAVFYVTARAAQIIGSPPRPRAPHPEGAITHELEIIDAVHAIEHHTDGMHWKVLTERECRRRQQQGEGTYSVMLPNAGGRTSTRWPDLVLEHPQHGRRAIEFELTDKYSDRLRRILDGYLYSPDYTQAIWLTPSPLLLRRLNRLADERAAQRYGENSRSRILTLPLPNDPRQIPSRVLTA